MDGHIRIQTDGGIFSDGIKIGRHYRNTFCRPVVRLVRIVDVDELCEIAERLAKIYGPQPSTLNPQLFQAES